MKVFKKAHLAGSVFAGGTFEVGAVNGHAEVEEAKEMGMRISQAC